MSTPIKLLVQPGQRFGLLTVVDANARKITPGSPRGERAAACVCDCGNTVTVILHNLFKEHGTSSCGCGNRERARLIARRTHRLTNHPLYGVHRDMMRRCYRPDRPEYPHYGGRGIRVCAPWHDVSVFIQDVEREIGPRPEGRGAGGRALYSLDRIDNDGNYEPGNVRWATAKEQVANRRPHGRAA